MRNLHSSSTKVGTVFISKKKGSSWLLAARPDQIERRMRIGSYAIPSLTIFTDSGCCFPAEGLLMTGWDCSGLHSTSSTLVERVPIFVHIARLDFLRTGCPQQHRA
eukprot:TRINITY_DN16106_c0_g1_i2.p1 TRINITY_DN16106_c0_g1~~TRINITY_DN16106_c0_g1_i2.p1  ORF type:complete len:106 (-),score=12.11 TRINITY_DN16106_c0_g1_i2:142-459(-)